MSASTPQRTAAATPQRASATIPQRKARAMFARLRAAEPAPACEILAAVRRKQSGAARPPA